MDFKLDLSLIWEKSESGTKMLSRNWTPGTDFQASHFFISFLRALPLLFSFTLAQWVVKYCRAPYLMICSV